VVAVCICFFAFYYLLVSAKVEGASPSPKHFARLAPYESKCESLLYPAATHASLLSPSGDGGDNLAGGVLLFGGKDEEDQEGKEDETEE
jgi:hypothetical protein